MQNNVSSIVNIKNKKLSKKIYRLNKFLLKQEEKVAYAYKNLETNEMFSFNLNTCFYSASVIKILVCLYIYKQAEINMEILQTKLKLKDEEFKDGSGVLKNNKKKKEYTVKELVYYTLKESDNTAYIKLVNFVTKEKLKAYGLSLGATHTLEGKDSFGIINASDVIIYLTHLYNYFKTDTSLSRELKTAMLEPSYQIIEAKNIGYNVFARKYGCYGVAYHEVGIVYDKVPYIVVVLTQKNELKNKRKYINKVVKKINKIHTLWKKTNAN